jgi:Family of unknown function (DUF6510)
MTGDSGEHGEQGGHQPSGPPEESEQPEQSEESELDGNALAGQLAEVFAFEATTSLAMCANCGSQVPLAAWVVYVNAPGCVARCPTCDRVQVRIVHDENDRWWVDLSGVASLEIIR